MPLAPPSRLPDLPPQQQPEPSQQPPPVRTSHVPERRVKSLESGLPLTERPDEDLPSIREMAAPLVGLVGRAAAAICRRSAAAATAAVAASDDGRSFAAAAASAFAVPPVDLEPLPSAGPPPQLGADELGGRQATVNPCAVAGASITAAVDALRLSCESRAAALSTMRVALPSGTGVQTGNRTRFPSR